MPRRGEWVWSLDQDLWEMAATPVLAWEEIPWTEKAWPGYESVRLQRIWPSQWFKLKPYRWLLSHSFLFTWKFLSPGVVSWEIWAVLNCLPFPWCCWPLPQVFFVISYLPITIFPWVFPRGLWRKSQSFGLLVSLFPTGSVLYTKPHTFGL